jgi:hypothetical protein
MSTYNITLSTAKEPDATPTHSQSYRCLIVSITAIVLLLLSLVFSVPAFAEPNTTIVGLTNAGQQIDGQTVTFEGEAIGDILNAGGETKWLLLQDGNASISVLISASDVERITYLGRYDQTGALIEVQGRFTENCDDHDGLTDVHATKITILDEGSMRETAFDIRELQIGALLIIIGACLYVLHWRLRERTR